MNGAHGKNVKQSLQSFLSTRLRRWVSIPICSSTTNGDIERTFQLVMWTFEPSDACILYFTHPLTFSRTTIHGDGQNLVCYTGWDLQDNLSEILHYSVSDLGRSRCPPFSQATFLSWRAPACRSKQRSGECSEATRCTSKYQAWHPARSEP